MAVYSLSVQADQDLVGIARYSILQFGPEQAQTYLQALHDAFERMARHPQSGRTAEDLAPNLWRQSVASDIVFYQPTQEGVLIVRVLHQLMNYVQHLE